MPEYEVIGEVVDLRNMAHSPGAFEPTHKHIVVEVPIQALPFDIGDHVSISFRDSLDGWLQ